MQVQGAMNLLFRPGLRKDFRDSYNQHEQQWSFFLKGGKMDKPEIEATIITGPSRLLELHDGEGYHYEDAKIGPKVAGVDKEFGLGFIITRKTIEDDQYGKANQASKWLARAAQLTKEYRAASFLDDAFTGSTFKGVDGLALCHTTHTTLNSATTWANRPSTEVGFSLAGVSALMDLSMLMKDHNGDPIPCKLNSVILGNNTGDLNRFHQIFGSEKEPFTTGNQDNAIKKRLGMPKHQVNVYKSSRKSYFMFDDTLNDAWFMTRRAVGFDDWWNNDTRAAHYVADMRFMIWFVDPRGWFGANPT